MPEASVEVALAVLKVQVDELTKVQLHTLAIVKTLVREIRELNAEMAQHEAGEYGRRKPTRPRKPTRNSAEAAVVIAGVIGEADEPKKNDPGHSRRQKPSASGGD